MKRLREERPTIPNALEVNALAGQVGWLPTIFMLIGIAAVPVLARYLWVLARDIHAMADKVNRLDASISHEKGNPVAHFQMLHEIGEELREIRQDAEAHSKDATRHYEDIERLNDQEVYARCNIDKCPHLLTVVNNVRELGHLFEQFNIRAEESRNASGASLKDIQAQMNTLATEVSAQSKQVVSLLGDVIVGRKK